MSEPVSQKDGWFGLVAVLALFCTAFALGAMGGCASRRHQGWSDLKINFRTGDVEVKPYQGKR